MATIDLSREETPSRTSESGVEDMLAQKERDHIYVMGVLKHFLETEHLVPLGHDLINWDARNVSLIGLNETGDAVLIGGLMAVRCYFDNDEFIDIPIDDNHRDLSGQSEIDEAVITIMGEDAVQLPTTTKYGTVDSYLEQLDLYRLQNEHSLVNQHQ